MMDLSPYVFTALAAVVLPAITFGACRLWHARRVRELHSRIEKIDRARQAAGQQAQQARKQIEQLQKELAAQHKARADAVSAHKRVQHLQETLREPRRELPESLLDIDAAPASPPHGFADTRPLQDGPGHA
jgi:DNA anti-recombination protein RmuC